MVCSHRDAAIKNKKNLEKGAPPATPPGVTVSLFTVFSFERAQLLLGLFHFRLFITEEPFLVPSSAAPSGPSHVRRTMTALAYNADEWPNLRKR
jgi:hypothetical protein